MLVDANGNTPIAQTAFEKRLAERTANGGMKAAMAELMRKQALPLEEKIALSKQIITDWYEAWEGNVSVSYSGGKDSELLLWLVRQLYPHVPAVFAHTGLEYPEVVRKVLDTPNHVIVRPEMRFAEVIRRHGWPMGSKNIARGVSIVRNPTSGNANVRRLYLDGVNRFGIPVQGYQLPQRWRFLLDAPFECSDKCCEVMKKKPMAKYERATGNRPFVGTMASDSKRRQRTYLQQGCNAFDMKRPRSAPLSFWTHQDVLACLHTYSIPIAPVYGEIVQAEDGTYTLTGERNTGCLFCAFGMTMEEDSENRFQRLSRTHPKLHHFVMKKLGLGEVLTYCQDNAPKAIAGKFKAVPNV